MSRCVEECYLASVLELDIVCTDVLCDATSLTGDDIGVAYVVEERCLTVVNVSHDGDDRSAALEVFLAVCHFLYSVRHFFRDILSGEAKLFCHDVDCFGVEALVDADHHADGHTSADNLCHRHIHHGGEFVGCNEFSELEHLAVCVFSLFLFHHALMYGVALVLAVFHTLLLLLGSEAGESFLYLLSHILFREFLWLWRLLLLVLLALSWLILLCFLLVGLVVAAIVVATAVVAAAVVAAIVVAFVLLALSRLAVGLLDGCIHVDFIVVDAAALLLLVARRLTVGL